jgi:hypothetical protein
LRRNEENQSMAAIQIVRFKLAPHDDEKEFRELNQRFQREVAPKLAGLERREATVGEGGEWVLVLRYRDVESARKAGKSDTSEVSQKFMTMIDMKTMSASFYEIASDG